MLNMLALLEILISWSLLFALALRYTRITRDLHSGRLARIICMAALGIAILPAAKILLPSIDLPIMPYPIWALLQWPVTPTGLMWLVVIYGVGLFLRLFPIILSHLDVRAALTEARSAPEHLQNALQKVAVAHGQTNIPRVLIADVSGPFTYGFIWPKIIFPERALTWQAARAQRVITHELAHIARNDWWWHGVLDLLLAFVWFLPGVKHLKQRFTWLSELNADDAVLNYDDNRTAYATDLLAIVQTTPQLRHAINLPSGKVPLIDRSYCYERMAAVLDGSRHRSVAPLRPSTLLSILGALVVWVSLGVLHIAPAHSVKFEPPLQRPIASPLIVMQVPDESGMLSPITPKPVLSTGPLPALPIIEEVVVRAEPEVLSPQVFSQNLAEQMRAERTVAFMPNTNFTVALEGHMPIQLVTPDYPKAAQRKKIEGSVTAQFDITATGAAHNIRITQSGAGDTFNNAVIEALQKSRFKPALHDGLPIATQRVEHVYTFKLSDNE